MADHTDSFNLDAGGYKREIRDLQNNYLRPFNKVLREVRDELNEHPEAFNNLNIQIEGVDKNGQKITGTLVKVDGAFKVVIADTIKLKDATVLLREEENRLQKVLQIKLKLQRDINREEKRRQKELSDAARVFENQITSATKDVKTENKRKERDFLKESVEFDRELSDIERRLTQYAAERTAALRGQLAVTNALNTAAASAAEQRRTENRELRQFQASQILAQRLQNQFITPNIGQIPQQRLGQAATAIGEVQTLIERGAIRASRAAQILNQAFAGNVQVLTGVESRVQGVGIELNRLSQTSEDSARRINLSLGQLGRILAIQLIHTAVNQFIVAMRQSIDVSKDFAIRIGEIETLSQNSGLAFEDWAKKVRTLSDEFGNPILDTAEGIYETISNQIARGGDAAEFMAKAMQFGRVAVASTADSVNILSSVINGYNLNITDTDRISAILFKTIDLGRVRASDLANTLGRITPVASTLGISFEELSAAIATLSIKGLTPSETLTSLNGLFTKLLNPTKETKKLFDDLGFKSGPGVVASMGGLEAVLRKVINASNSGKIEIQEVFNEIRALRGGLGLTNDALQGYSKNLNDITNNSQAAFNKAQQIINDNVGIKFQKQLEQVKNFFIRDFGLPIINTLVNWGVAVDETGKQTSGFVDKIRNVSEILKIVAVTTVSAALATRLFSRASLSAAQAAAVQAGQTTLLQARLTNLRTAITANAGAIGATFVAGLAFTFYEEGARRADNIARTFETVTSRIDELTTKSTELLKQQLAVQKEAFQKDINARFLSHETYISKILAASEKLGQAQEKIVKKTSKEIQDTFDVYAKGAQSFISSLEAQSNTALSNIEKAQRKISELRDGLVTRRFESQIVSLPEPEQITAIQREIVRLQQLSIRQLQTAAVSPPEVAKALQAESEKAAQRAESLQNQLLERRAKAAEKYKEATEKAAEIAQRITASAGQDKAADNLRNVNREQAKTNAERRKIDAEGATDALERKNSAQDELTATQRIEELRRQRKQKSEADAEAAKQQKILDLLGQQATQQASIDAFQKQLITNLDRLAQAQQAAADAAKQQAEQERLRLESLKTLFQDIAALPSKLPKDISKGNVGEVRKEISDKFTEAIQSVSDPNLIKQLTDQQQQLMDEVTRRFNDTQNNLLQTNLQGQKQAILQTQNDLTRQLAELSTKQVQSVSSVQAQFEQLQTILQNTGIGANLGLDAKSVENLRQAFEKLKTSKNDAEITTLKNQLRDLLQQAIFNIVEFKSTSGLKGFFGGGKTAEDIELVPGTVSSPAKTLADLQQAMQDAINAIKPPQTVQAELQKKQADFNAKLAATNAQLATMPALTQNATNSLQGLSQASDQLAAQFRNFQFPGGPPPVQRALGGWGPRGTDTVPAWLSPGEFVVNAAAARVYWKDLMQMNSQSKPIYRAQGGPVPYVTGLGFGAGFSVRGGDSVTINGGIHATIQSTGNTQGDAKSFVTEINRAIRRGEISLRQS